MYCSNCGNEINENMNFCPSCGTKIQQNIVQNSFNGEEKIKVEKTINTYLNTDNNKIENYDTIPLYKIIFLSIFTLGFYDYFYFAKCWKRYSQISGVKVSPFWRGYFTPITFFSFAPKIKDYFIKNEVDSTVCLSFGLPFCYFISFILKQYLIGFLLGFLFILPIQNKINKINSAKYPNANIDNFNFKDFLVLILSWIFVCCTLVSTANSY